MLLKPINLSTSRAQSASRQNYSKRSKYVSPLLWCAHLMIMNAASQAALERVAPVALLYLQHWHAPVSTSAHALCTALVQHAHEVNFSVVGASRLLVVVSSFIQGLLHFI